ncbi:hypothetical protein OTK49_02215 [Vibrio coralliirubri]|uniref:hypothetical protein n=1 Tax=Vibrio coralliirubri TaxID=1516159 RepID=UPI002283CFA5|nr:hypothetical protein [Vibrio coralliirubri]MCY9861330.1 hypothetical protein [Vibrio coralliirubri]
MCNPLRLSARKSIADIMINENVAASSAILKKYPELGDYQAFEQTQEDLTLIDYLSHSKTPPMLLMDTICKQTGLERLFVQRLLSGDGTDRAYNALYKRQASSGGKQAVKSRVDALQSYIESVIAHPEAQPYPKGIANSINTKLGYPDEAPENRVAHLINDKCITLNDFAWLIYDASSLKPTPEAGARIVTRRLMKAAFNEKHLVVVSFTDTPTIVVARRTEVINRNKLTQNALSICIPNGMTPAEYNQSDVIQMCERELDVIYSQLGYKSYSDYLENLATKNAEEAEAKAKKKAFRKMINSEGLYSALRLNQSSEDIAIILDVTNRHIKDRKTCSYPFAQQVYLTKTDVLVGAVKSGDATVTQLVKRPNPFMLDESDMLPINDVLRITEKIFFGEQYSLFSTKSSISEMFTHFIESGIVTVEENKLVSTSDDLTYSAAFVRYLRAINKESIATALAELFSNKTQVLECFLADNKKAKRCDGRWINMDKHFNSDYANVWEISFNEKVFHLPYLSMPAWTDLTAPEVSTPYSKIGGRSVSMEECERYPLEVCLEKIGHYARTNIRHANY